MRENRIYNSYRSKCGSTFYSNLSDTWRLNQSMPFTPMTKLTGCPNIVELMKESQRYSFANNFMFFISTGHCINGIKHIIDSVHIFFIKERNRFFFLKQSKIFVTCFFVMYMQQLCCS